MTRFHKSALIISLAIGSAACIERGPVVVEFTSQTLRIPRDREFTEIYVSRDAAGFRQEPGAISLEICDQHVTEKQEAACHLHGNHGTQVFIRDARLGSEFELLKERPVGVARPGEADLTPLDWDDKAPLFNTPLALENYTLSRLKNSLSREGSQLSTTDRGWPIARCDQHHLGVMYCSFGFLIDGAAVEARWFSPSDRRAISQGEVWDIASDIELRLRRISA